MDIGTIRRTLSTSSQRWWLLGLLLFLILLSISYGQKAVQDRSAIVRWRPQIQQLDTVDIYQRFAYPNPPIMALLLGPIVHLSPLAGSLCWFYIKVGLTLLALRWVFRLTESPGMPFPLWAKVLTVVLSLRPIMGDLSHGNVNLLIMFLVVAALYALHRGQDVASGLILALAIACKVTPLLFVPYFAWKRAWRALAGCAIGLALFLVVVPGYFLGMSRNLSLLGSWYGCMVRPFMASGEVTTDLLNQSLPGLVFRLLTPNPSLHEKDVPAGYEHLANLDPQLLGWFLKACMAAFAGLVLFSCRTPTRSRRWGAAMAAAPANWRLATEFSLVVLGMLLFSERTWKHHCVTLVLPFAVVCYYLAACRPGWKMRAYLLGTLATVTLLMMSTSTTGIVESWDSAAKVAQVEGAYVWAFLLLIATMVVLLLQKAAPCSSAAMVAGPQEETYRLDGPHRSATFVPNPKLPVAGT
jgi:hypothetical protein